LDQTTVELVGPEEKAREQREETFFAALSLFLWIFLAALLLLIFIRYLL
jgi:hypothetical protein